MKPTPPVCSSPLARRWRRWAGPLCLSGLLVLGTAASLQAGEPHSLGAKPLTDADRTWLAAHAETPGEVRLNKLAVERINAERRTRGLAPLSIAGVALGQEINPLKRGERTTRAQSDAAQVTAAALPVGVDNSTLKSFPPVVNQGDIGSCLSFASTYYAATAMTGLLRGTDNKGTANPVIFSPKWTYTMTNGGGDNGGTFTPVYAFLLGNGIATLADVPYSGTKDPGSYLPWSIDPAIWRRAITYRMNQSGQIKFVKDDGSLDADALNQARTLLANGYVFNYGTNVDNWRYTNIKHDPASNANDAGYVGKPGCGSVQFTVENGKPSTSGHAMCVVGYNDDVWIDINNNGVVDAGEKGAFRICNSWGTDWAPDTKQPENRDGGLTWLSYDALRPVSAVPGAPTANREAAFVLFDNSCFYLTPRATPYTPTLVAQFTLNAAKRDQLNVSVGSSAPGAAAPTATAPTGAVTTAGNEPADGAPLGKGGAYAFNGGTAAINGGFAFDLTDVANTGTPQRYYLSVGDLQAGSPSQVLDFVLTDAAGNALTTTGQAVNVPGTADNSTVLTYVDYGSASPVAAPPAINSALTATATAGTAFSYQITAANNPTSYAASSLPMGLSVDAATGLVSGTPATAGTYTVGLSANNAGGTGSAALTLTVNSPTGVPVPTFDGGGGATGMVGMVFSYQIAAAPAVMSYTLDGTIPPGLAFNPTTGSLTGTPLSAGTFILTVGATNASGTSTQLLTVTINRTNVTTVPAITSSAQASVTAGDVLTYRTTATNHPTRFAATGLPDGVAINAATGVISGTTPLARAYTVVISATNAAGSGYLTLNLNVLGDSSFAPQNDDFSNATNLLSANPATDAGSNPTATAEQGEPTHAGQAAVRSVWWQWTSPSTGAATVDTAGSNFKTVVEVYTGDGLESLQSVGAGNGDGALAAGKVTFQATAGTTYRIAVDGYQAGAGAIALRVTAASGPGTEKKPANDKFANRTILPAVIAPPMVTGENINAKGEEGEPVPPGETNPANAVWYSYTPPSSGLLTIDTEGSDFDTVLSVYTGTEVNALEIVGSDDQGGPDNTSKLTIPVTQGVPYQIAVSGFGGTAEGSIELHANLAAAAPITVAATVTTQTVTAAGGEVGIIAIRRIAGDLTVPVIVSYTVRGSAQPGVDYQMLKGFVKLTPDRDTRFIKIKPIDRGPTGNGRVRVKILIQPGTNYTVEGETKGKVIILQDDATASAAAAD